MSIRIDYAPMNNAPTTADGAGGRMTERIIAYPDGGANAWGEAREEIVRCRDCKRFAIDQSDHEYRSGWWCARWNTDMVKPDGFCAWGERRDARS